MRRTAPPGYVTIHNCNGNPDLSMAASSNPLPSGSHVKSNRSRQRLPAVAATFPLETSISTTVQARIFRLVHHAHATSAKLLQYSIMGNRFSGEWVGRHCAAMLGCASSQVNEAQSMNTGPLGTTLRAA